MRILLTALGFAATATTSAAQGIRCDTLHSEVTLGPLSGQRIDSVAVETAAPRLGKLASAIGRFHVRTRASVVQRELLFAVGDTVDTLRVAESLRRLRALPILDRVQIEARHCSSDTRGYLALAVLTRDSWTSRPDLKAGSSSARVGLTERNLFGTGRTVSVDLVSHNGAIGGGVTVLDGFGFGTGVTTRAQYQRYSDGAIKGLLLSRHQATLSDSWRASLDISDQRYEPRSALSDNFERTSGELLAGVRLTPRRSAHAVYALGGIASEYGSLVAAPNADIVGPTRIDRRFTGPEIGTAIVATRYDTLTWLFDNGSVVDVPRGFEGEAVIGIGRGTVNVLGDGSPSDVPRPNFMTHYDAWFGREWLPDRSSRIASDLWLAGYSRSGDWRSSHLRTAISAEHAAGNGIWRFTGASEQLNDPDPDVRALAMYDRAIGFVPKRARLAESAFAFSLERTRHLHAIGSALEIDGSLFGALSKRWDPSPGALAQEDFSVGLVGIGLSLAPRRAGRATVRIDYGLPVIGSAGISRRPRLNLTLLPWMEAGRRRDRSGSF